MFTWEGKRIAMKPIPPPLKLTKEKSKSISICNPGEFLMESKETKQRFALIVKEEIGSTIEIPKKMKPMLEEFQRIVHDELLDELSPMKDIQHHIDLIPGASLPNLAYYWMNPKESEVLRDKVEELIQNRHMIEHESICYVGPFDTKKEWKLTYVHRQPIHQQGHYPILIFDTSLDDMLDRLTSRACF